MDDLRYLLPIALLLLLTIYIVSLRDREIVEYKSRIDSLERVVVDKEADIEMLTDELELREMEISFLGHSLDSVKYNIKP